MNKIHYRFIWLFSAAILCLASSLFTGSAPTKHTAAPGEQSCASCHPGNINTGSGTVSLNFGSSLSAGYIPGNTYTITYTLNGNVSKYGFSATALNNSNLMAGDFTALNTATTKVDQAVVMGTTRKYVGHKSATNTNSWSFQWIAPSSNVGTVSFYIAANASNSDNAQAGDTIYEDVFSLQALQFANASFSVNKSSICDGDDFVFTSTSVGSGLSYSWDFGPGASPATANTIGPHTVSYTGGGSKAVKLTVGNPGGSDSTTQTVTVFNNPSPIISASDTSLCQGQSTTISTSGSFGTYLWSTSSTDSTISTSTAGSYSLQVIDSNGCSGLSDTLNIVVNPNPTATVLASDTVLCQGDTATLTGGGAFPGYLWSSSDTTQSISITNSGSYTLTVIDTNGCTNQSPPVNITVNALPTTSIFSSGMTLQDTLFALPGFASYQWFFSDANGQNLIPIPGALKDQLLYQDFYFKPGNSGYVVLAILDGNSCLGYSQPYTLPVIQSINSSAFEEINIYPNPMTNKVRLELSLHQAHTIQIRLTELSGKTVYQSGSNSSVKEAHFDLYLPNLAKGVYLLKIDAGESQYHEKIMVR